LPAYQDRIAQIESDSSEEDGVISYQRVEVMGVSTGTVVPLSEKTAPSPLLNLDKDADTEDEATLEDPAESQEENFEELEAREARGRQARCVKRFCCKSFGYLYLRDKTKPRASCDKIFCSNFLKARLHLLRFKVSWDYLVDVEQNTAPKIFVILALMIIIFTSVAMILPFLASFLGKEECSSVSPLYVYAAYGGFIIVSTAVECGILMILRKAMTFDGQKMLPLNRYLFAKWFQGQFANLVYFLHFCYVSAALMCLQESGGAEASSAAELGTIDQTASDLEKSQ
jgi:hypothetical protein